MSDARLIRLSLWLGMASGAAFIGAPLWIWVIIAVGLVGDTLTIGGTQFRLLLVALFPPPLQPSRIRTAELEFAVGLRDDDPRAYQNHCERVHCPGVEIVPSEGVYCPLGLTELCWHRVDERGAWNRRPSPVLRRADPE